MERTHFLSRFQRISQSTLISYLQPFYYHDANYHVSIHISCLTIDSSDQCPFRDHKKQKYLLHNSEQSLVNYCATVTHQDSENHQNYVTQISDSNLTRSSQWRTTVSHTNLWTVEFSFFTFLSQHVSLLLRGTTSVGQSQ